MNVQIKHDNVDISSYCISYEREHKICTGIGQLQLTLSLTYPTTINPWDQIKIYENGSFQVTYYVSSVSKSQPDGTITLECQDRSKRLIDYFIPDQYTIDYPSYTGYWIKKFLTEAGVSYSFSVPDTGKLLSNYTTMGLAPAYEQIMTLLQLSGWYMFFDGNGVAKIGTLTSDFSNVKATFNKNNILEISKVTDDKMLRNRAVVWGAFDAVRNDYAYADVSTNTRWNYDRRDLRTMVVSNGNIPNKSSAFGIANMLLKEFSKVTVEKHLSVAGAAGRDLGDVVRVRSNVYNGSGLITTYGVSMSRSGLITNMILDERCPRLFGFFDFGDYVYVGTYGDGVWRKHLQFNPAWYNFSAGLTDLAVTDLHINNEVFSAVTASGGMFYSPDNEGPWQPFTIASLTSSFEASLELGPGGALPSGVVMTTFSGLMGRATIVDKLTNVIKYGIDTYSGVNYGDYFMMYSGLMSSGIVASGVTSSGVSSSSGFRGWIVEYDPFNFASGVYPISISGNYNIRVLDLENDGLNDYVSVKQTGFVEIGHTEFGYNFGKHTSQPSNYTQDKDALVAFGPLSEFSGVPTKYLSGSSTLANKPVVFENESINERELVWRAGGAFKRLTITKSPLASSTLTSPTTSPALPSALAIIKTSTNNYRAYGVSVNSDGESGTFIVKYLDWDANANTCGAVTDVVTLTVPNNTYHSAFTENMRSTEGAVVNGILYMVINHEINAGNPGSSDPDWDLKANNYTEIYVLKTDLAAGTGSGGLVATFNFPTSVNALGGADWTIQNLDNGITAFQNGDRAEAFFLLSATKTIDGYLRTNYLIYSHDCENFSISELENTTNPSDTNMFLSANSTEAAQLTGEHFFALWRDTNRNNATYIYNGYTFQITTLSSIPWNFQAANIYPLFGTYDNYFIARNGTDWYFCNPLTLSPEKQFIPPVGLDIIKPYSTTDSASPRYYWQAFDPATLEEIILQTTENTTMSTARMQLVGGFQQTGRGFICGNFFIDYKDISYTSATLAWVYLDNQNPPRIGGSSFMVLQRDGTDFHLIQESAKPIRVDISNSTPLLTVLDTEDTFKSHYIFENEILTVHTSHTFGLAAFGMTPPSGVRDYRYTMLEVPSGVEISSGIMGSGIYSGAEKLLLYTMGSGINFAYTNELASGFVQMYAMPSGLAERIETSNFCGSGQYVFVTTSGDSPSFYQKDPMSEIFASFSGLPVSRATIIRLDDRF